MWVSLVFLGAIGLGVRPSALIANMEKFAVVPNAFPSVTVRVTDRAPPLLLPWE